MNMTYPLARPVKAQKTERISTPRFDKLRNDLDLEVEEARLPSVVVTVACHGEQTFTHASGWLDQPAGTPMREDALFRIFSMTKPITSVAIMMLIERGALALTDLVVDYLPELGQAWRKTTVEHLLLHASRLTHGVRCADPGVRSTYESLGIPVNPRDIGVDEFLRRIALAPLIYPPGTAWEYGLSTDLLGILIERCTGRRLNEWLDLNVFHPLEMNDTSFQVAADEVFRVAQPFHRDPVDGTSLKIPDQTLDPASKVSLDSGGAGLISTAADYLRFASMLLGGGQLGYVRLLQADTVRKMTNDHLHGRLSAPVSPGHAALQLPAYGFGLGLTVRLDWSPNDLPGDPGIFFWSGTSGTMFWVDPQAQLVDVYMTQSPGLSRQHYRRWIMPKVYEAIECL